MYAQFSLDVEQLALPIRPKKGEEDGFVIYPDPDARIPENAPNKRSTGCASKNLPTALADTGRSAAAQK